MPRDPVALDEAIDDACASKLDDAVRAAGAPPPRRRRRARGAGAREEGTPPKKTPLVKQAKRYASRFFKPEMSRQPFVPDDLEVLREVGRGAFRRVYVSRVKGGGGALFAVKVLRKAEVLRGGGAECAFTERALGADLRHAGVVRLRCAFQTKKALYLVSDYYPVGR